MKTLAMTTVVCVALLLVPGLAMAQVAEEPGCCKAKAEAAQSIDGANTESAKASCCASKAIDAPDVENARHGKGAGKGKRGCGGGGNGCVMRNAHTLVFNNESITRVVEQIPGGVKTTNTTTNPELVDTLRKHPREMVSHLADGGHVRKWDPLFAELAKHSDEVEMEFRDIKNGIEVISTSKNPEVVKLIRAHAVKVNEFVNRGRAAMREKTPLPKGYEGN